MADQMTPEQVNALFKGGNLSKDTYDKYQSSMPEQGSEKEQLNQELESKSNPEQAALEEGINKRADYLNFVTPAGDKQGKTIEDFKNQAVGEKIGEQEAQSEAAKASSEKAISDFQAKQAEVTSANAQRAKLGLAPLPMPEPPKEALSASALNGPNGANMVNGNPELAGGVAPKLASEVNKENLQESPQQKYLQNMQSAVGNTNNAYALKEQGIQKEMDAGAKKAAAEAGVYNETQKQLGVAEANRQQQEKVRNTQLDQAKNDYESAMKDYKDAKIDPNHLWNSYSDGDKVKNTILLAIGGFFGGTNNAVQQKLNTMIDRDIASQKSNIERQGDYAKGKQNTFEMMRQKFGDERSAEQATKLALLEGTEMKIKKLGAQYSSPQAQGKMQQMLADVELQKQQAMMGLQQSIMQSPAMLQRSQQAMQISRLPEHQQAEAYKEMGEYQKHEKSVNDVKNNLDDLYKYRYSINPSDRAKYNAAKTFVLSGTTEMFGGKSENEFKLVEDALGSRGVSKDAYNQVIDKFVNKMNSQKSFPILENNGIIQPKVQMNAPVRTAKR